MAGVLLPPRAADMRLYNQRIVLNMPGSVYHGKTGRVIKSYFLRHMVVFDEVAHPGDARGLLFPAHELELSTEQETP